MVYTGHLDPAEAERALAAVDRHIAALLTAILTHERFRALEAAWRGVRHLVDQAAAATEAAGADAAPVRIELLDATVREVSDGARALAAGRDDPVMELLYGERIGDPGLEPFGLLVLDGVVDRRPDNVETIRLLTEMAAIVGAPLLMGAGPGLAGGDTARVFEDAAALGRLPDNAALAPWRGLREPLEARFLGLVAPRILARLPYRAAPMPGSGTFTEPLDGGIDADPIADLPWMNGAWAVAALLTRDFLLTGAWFEPEPVTGPDLEGLPALMSSDAGWRRACTVEVILGDGAAALGRLGVVAVEGKKDEPGAAAPAPVSLHQPKAYDRAAATAGAKAHAMLPIVLLGARFSAALQIRLSTRAGPADLIAADVRDWLADYTAQAQPDGYGVTASGDNAPLSRIEVDHKRVPRTGETVLVVRLFPAAEPASAVPIQLTLPLG